MDKLLENAGLVKPEALKAEDLKAEDLKAEAFKAEALEAPAPDLLSMGEKGLGAEIEKLGFPRYRAGQIWRQMLAGTSDFSEMTDLPLAMRQTLAERYVTGVPAIERRLISKIDGTRKYLFRCADGETIESALMEYRHGLTICVSTQVGCNMACAFCASGIGGKRRDLTAGEILGQVAAAQRDVGRRISGVVMMGIGEPLDNYDAVISFLGEITSSANEKYGLCIGARHISLSTCGLCDKIERLAGERYEITLSISLHAADDETRRQLMPVAKRWSLDDLLSACRDYFDRTHRRISFEYTLVPGRNDSPSDAGKLAALLKRYMGARPFHVNLIPVNAVEGRFAAGSRASAARFAAGLTRLGVNATVRRTLGPDINASCGQLRRGAGE